LKVEGVKGKQRRGKSCTYY